MQNAVNCRTGREVLGANTEIELSPQLAHTTIAKKGDLYTIVTYRKIPLPILSGPHSGHCRARNYLLR